MLLEGNSYPFNLDLKGYEIDTIAEYGTKNINVSKTVELYKGHPATVNAKASYSEWWWPAISMGSDFGFHCPSRAAARQLFHHGRTVWLHSHKVSHMSGSSLPGMECVAHLELGSLFFQSRPDSFFFFFLRN